MPRQRETADHQTPVSLILRLRDGTDAEWRLFWDIYGPVVYRLARRHGMNHHDAQDIVCDVMRSLHARIRRGLTVDHGKGRFRGYVGRAVQRSVARFRRGRSAPGLAPASTGAKVRSAGLRARSLDDVAEPSGDDSEIAALERQERVRACLDRLRRMPEVRQRDVEAFVQYVIEDQDAQTVSKRFGISRGRLYGIRSEMIHRLRLLLAELERDWTELDA